MDPPGIEPGSHPCKGRILPLDYRPNNLIRPSQFLSFPKIVCRSRDVESQKFILTSLINIALKIKDFRG